jgi:hypothetical protein
MTFEYLEAGPEPTRRWHRIVFSAFVVLALVAGGVFWWSGRVREQANDALGQAVVHASRDARAGEAVVLSMLQYSSPQIWSTMVGEDVRAGLRKLVQRSADQVVRTLESARNEAQDAYVLPWDGTQREAKDAVLALVDAQLGRFERIASDATAIGTVFSEPQPSADRARALLRMSGASVDDGH